MGRRLDELQIELADRLWLNGLRLLNRSRLWRSLDARLGLLLRRRLYRNGLLGLSLGLRTLSLLLFRCGLLLGRSYLLNLGHALPGGPALEAVLRVVWVLISANRALPGHVINL
jgi:hypothetical protein